MSAETHQAAASSRAGRHRHARGDREGDERRGGIYERDGSSAGAWLAAGREQGDAVGQGRPVYGHLGHHAEAR